MTVKVFLEWEGNGNKGQPTDKNKIQNENWVLTLMIKFSQKPSSKEDGRKLPSSVPDFLLSPLRAKPAPHEAPLSREKRQIKESFANLFLIFLARGYVAIAVRGHQQLHIHHNLKNHGDAQGD